MWAFEAGAEAIAVGKRGEKEAGSNAGGGGHDVWEEGSEIAIEDASCR